MSKEHHILAEDKQWLEARIRELEQTIQDLGPDFYDVFNQSSETWHDNAPFEALRDKQSVLFSELSALKRVRAHAVLGLPKKKPGVVNIGSVVIIKGKKIFVAGSWTPRAGTKKDEATIVSAESPLAQAILGKKPGHETAYGTIETIIEMETA